MIVRWFPIQSAPKKEFAIVGELAGDHGGSKFDATALLAKVFEVVELPVRPGSRAMGVRYRSVFRMSLKAIMQLRRSRHGKPDNAPNVAAIYREYYKYDLSD